MATERPTDDLQPGQNDHGTESWLDQQMKSMKEDHRKTIEDDFSRTHDIMFKDKSKQSLTGIVEYLRAKDKETPGEGLKLLTEILNEGNTINENLANKIAALIVNPTAEYNIVLPEPTHFKFTVWWVDKSFSDVSTVIVAESEAAALSVVEEDENFNYSVRVIKGGSKFSEES